MRHRRGFTLVELLMVIVIITFLLALLLPAINGALRSARRAAVTAEINVLAQALANFKSKYGDYPPSRILLVENGDYSSIGSNASLSMPGILPYIAGPTDPTSPGVNDITVGQLAQRSLAALRKFFPRLVLSTSGPVFANTSTTWYDFNGDGVLAPPNGVPQAYVLHGHECLVFFLGGIQTHDPKGDFGLIGFGKDPTNPFSNNVAGSFMYSDNREPPIFEFNGPRLFLDPSTQVPGSVPGTTLPGMPAYYDSLNNPSPQTAGTTRNFYAYFSAYGNGRYDPNDINFNEADAGGNGPIGLNFSVLYPTYPPPSNVSSSLAPNPYTSTLTVAPPAVTYQSPQSFQIISSGIDGLYGVGGQFSPNSLSSAAEALPIDTLTAPSPYINTTDLNVRKREQDNLTSFKSGSLE
jgi:general secretion pathway protein G